MLNAQMCEFFLQIWQSSEFLIKNVFRENVHEILYIIGLKGQATINDTFQNIKS